MDQTAHNAEVSHVPFLDRVVDVLVVKKKCL